MSLLKTSVRCSGMLTRSLPALGGGLKRPINPISPNFPYTNRDAGGTCALPGTGPYSMIEALKGNNPIRGPLIKVPYKMGGVYKPNMDPAIHFNCQDRFEMYSLSYHAKLAFTAWWSARGYFVAFFFPFITLWTIAIIGVQRREPLETAIDRETFWKYYDLWTYGCYYDHHAFSHMLCVRRANKWQYEDITLEGGHHH